MTRLRKAKLSSPEAPLLGAAVYFYNPAFLEISANAGFTVAWIEMEHGFITFAEAADLCRIATGLGMLTMIRIADARRENILKAAECGPDIIDLPMANTRADAEQLVRYARFRPLGERGFYSVSRSLDYGMVESVARAQQQLNEDLALLVQIETAEALANLKDICQIPGVDLFIGPADISASLDVPGQTGHTKVYEAAKHVVATARQYNKMVAVGAAPQDFAFYAREGVDLLFAINDLSALKLGAVTAMRDARSAIAQAQEAKSLDMLASVPAGQVG